MHRQRQSVPAALVSAHVGFPPLLGRRLGMNEMQSNGLEREMHCKLCNTYAASKM